MDVTGPSVSATLDTGTWSLIEGDGDRLYLLDPGRPDKNPQKNRNGAIEIVSLADRHVEHVDIGRAPQPTWWVRKPSPSWMRRRCR